MLKGLIEGFRRHKALKHRRKVGKYIEKAWQALKTHNTSEVEKYLDLADLEREKFSNALRKVRL